MFIVLIIFSSILLLLIFLFFLYSHFILVELRLSFGTWKFNTKIRFIAWIFKFLITRLRYLGVKKIIGHFFCDLKWRLRSNYNFVRSNSINRRSFRHVLSCYTILHRLLFIHYIEFLLDVRQYFLIAVTRQFFIQIFLVQILPSLC